MTESGISWNICVVTRNLGAQKKYELSNALLYGDKVVWIPTSLPLYMVSKRIRAIRRIALEQIEYHMHLIEDIEQNQLPVNIPFPLNNFTEYLVELWYEFLSPPRDRQTLSQMRFEEVARRNRDIVGYIDNIEDPVSIFLGISALVLDTMDNANACIIDPRSSYYLKTPSHWDTEQATQILMNTLSDIFFPNVSSLPMLEVMELRERAKDELSSMRAELLSLTENLREKVKDESNQQEIIQESKNIINSRVKPIVLDTDKRIKDLLSSRWRTFFRKTISAIAFFGAGFFDINLAKEGIKNSVDASTGLLIREDTKLPLKSTAQFVIEIRSHYNKRFRF